MYNSDSLEKCLCLFINQYKQDIKHFQHPRKFLVTLCSHYPPIPGLRKTQICFLLLTDYI